MKENRLFSGKLSLSIDQYQLTKSQLQDTNDVKKERKKVKTKMWKMSSCLNDFSAIPQIFGGQMREYVFLARGRERYIADKDLPLSTSSVVESDIGLCLLIPISLLALTRN